MFVFSHTKARDLGTIWICWSPGHLTGKHIAVWNCPGHDGKTRDGAQEKEVGGSKPLEFGSEPSHIAGSREFGRRIAGCCRGLGAISKVEVGRWDETLAEKLPAASRDRLEHLRSGTLRRAVRTLGDERKRGRLMRK